MKKFIPLLAIVVIAVSLQSCRQDDETHFVRNQSNEAIIVGTANRTVTDTVAVTNTDKDPPIKDGTHWRNGN